MTDSEKTEVQPQGAQESVATSPNQVQKGFKAAPAEKHAPRTSDKFAERRLALKKQKRKAHRHNIAASNRNG